MARYRYPNGMVILTLACALATAQPSEDASLRDAIKHLTECVTTDCTLTVETLIRAGTVSMQVLLAEFDNLPSVAAFNFRTRVVARLPPGEAGPILLEEYRRNEPAYDEFAQLAKRAAAGEHIDDDDPEYADLFRRYNRARWTAAALGNLRYRPGYEAVWSKYVSLTEFRDGHFELVQGLFGMDPDRALRDFACLVESQNDAERVKGVKSFRQVAQTPPCTVLERLFDDPFEQVRREAYQLLYYTTRDCVDVLIHLTENTGQNVRDAAEMRLRYLGHISQARWQIMMNGADTPERRAAVWRDWWRESQHLMDAQLRERGFKAALALAHQQLDAPLVSFLAEYAEFAELYTMLRRALSSPDKATEKATLEAVQRLALRGESRAVDILLDHASFLPVTEATPCADAISKLRDPRVVPFLLQMLEKAPPNLPTDSRSILLALGNTGDARAIEPILSILLTRTDGTEQYAAMVLPKLNGAAAVQPKLLARLIEEPNHNTRYALRETIRKIGGTSLPKELTGVLPKAGAGDDSFEGPQKDVLLLMEEFPDPAAVPLLRALLKAESRFSRLYAARALATLGDTSGSAVVLDDLFTQHAAPFHFYAHDVGKAIKDIGDPATRERLERLCLGVEGSERQRVLGVISQQDDPIYVPYLGKLIKRDDRATQCGAAFAIASLIHKTPDIQKQKGLDPAQDAQVRAARVMFRWALRDERPNPDCGAFPDHGLLNSMSGAVVEIAKKRYLLYRIDDDSVTPLSESKEDDKTLIDRAKPRSEGPWGYGSLGAEESQGFLSVFLRLDYGGAGYLFRNSGGDWVPVCGTGGFIE